MTTTRSKERIVSRLWRLRSAARNLGFAMLSVFVAIGTNSCMTGEARRARESMIAKVGSVTVHRWICSQPIRGYVWIDQGTREEVLIKEPSKHLEIAQVSGDNCIRYFVKIGRQETEIVFKTGIRPKNSIQEIPTTYSCVFQRLPFERGSTLLRVELYQDGKLLRAGELQLIK